MSTFTGHRAGSCQLLGSCVGHTTLSKRGTLQGTGLLPLVGSFLFSFSHSFLFLQLEIRGGGCQGEMMEKNIGEKAMRTGTCP